MQPGKAMKAFQTDLEAPTLAWKWKKTQPKSLLFT
jgi:hypothetical protein